MTDEKHKHECEENPHSDDGLLCDRRGYHLCSCGATCGRAQSSEWIKSSATEGWPGELFGLSRFI